MNLSVSMCVCLFTDISQEMPDMGVKGDQEFESLEEAGLAQ